VINMIM